MEAMNQSEGLRQADDENMYLSVRRAMTLSVILELSIETFRSNKLRFVLTALGMVIGTASVILVVTIGLTGKQYILEELQKIETNSIELEYSNVTIVLSWSGLCIGWSPPGRSTILSRVAPSEIWPVVNPC